MRSTKGDVAGMVRAEPNIEWQVVAMDRVARLLRTVTRALDSTGVAYAVVGGNAVATWVAVRDVGAVRATKDVDLLLRSADLDRAASALEPAGFLRDEVLGFPVFLEADDPLPSQCVHVVLANEFVRKSAKYPAPDVASVRRSASGYLVLDLVPLIAMKLDAYRRVDQVHMEDLLRVGLIDAEVAGRLPKDLRERLREIRDTMEWFTDPPAF